MFSHPTLVARHGGGDAEGKAFFAQQGVAAVAGPEAHDEPLLGEVGDVGILGIARPSDIFCTGGEGTSHRVQALHKDAGLFDFTIHGRAQAGHDPHIGDHIRAVGNLDAVLSDRGANRAHAEGDDIHGAATHAACDKAVQARFHLRRCLPVVGGASVFLRARADECAFLHAGDITLVAANEQGIRALFCVQPKARTRGDDGLAHGKILSLGTIAPMDGIRLGEGGDFLHPTADGGGNGMFGGLR